jgi:hypothetical protein
MEVLVAEGAGIGLAAELLFVEAELRADGVGA